MMPERALNRSDVRITGTVDAKQLEVLRLGFERDDFRVGPTVSVEDARKTGMRAGVDNQLRWRAKRKVAALLADQFVENQKVGPVGAAIDRRGNAGNFELHDVAAAALCGILQRSARTKPARVAKPTA